MQIQLTDRLAELHQVILKHFATTGNSPTLVDVQRHFGLEDEEGAERLIAELEGTKAIHRNPGDRLVTHAYPFSNEPTPYKVRLGSGTELYAMCAVDALGIPFMLDQNATIESECMQCQRAVGVTVQDGELVGNTPDSLLVGYLPLGCCSTPATEQCPHINFFCSEEHLQEWMNSHPEEELKALSLQEAIERGKEIFGEMMNPSSASCFS